MTSAGYRHLVLGTAVGTIIALAAGTAPVMAQDGSSAELKKQIDLLKQQMSQMESEVDRHAE